MGIYMGSISHIYTGIYMGSISFVQGNHRSTSLYVRVVYSNGRQTQACCCKSMAMQYCCELVPVWRWLRTIQLQRLWCFGAALRAGRSEHIARALDCTAASLLHRHSCCPIVAHRHIDEADIGDRKATIESREIIRRCGAHVAAHVLEKDIGRVSDRCGIQILSSAPINAHLLRRKHKIVTNESANRP